MSAVPISEAPDGFDKYLEQTIGAIPRPVNWRKLRAVDARATWAVLDNWTSWLVDRYCLEVREIPACWYLHGAIVEELSALHGAWLVAFDPNQAASAAADWHRTLWDTRQRLREWLSRTGCTAREHRADNWSARTTTGCAYAAAFETYVDADSMARHQREMRSAVLPNESAPYE